MQPKKFSDGAKSVLLFKTAFELATLKNGLN